MNTTETLQSALEQHRTGDLRRAEAMYRELLRAEPRNADVLQLLGVLARQTGRVELALDLLGQALDVVGPHAIVLHNRAAVLQDAGRIGEAIASYRQALAARPGWTESALPLALLLRRSGDIRGARQVLEEAIQRQPRSADLHFELAVLLEALDEVPAALFHVKAAVKHQPDLVRAYIKGGDLWDRLGETPNAIRWYEQALQLRPDSPAALSNLARALHSLGHWDQAIACCRRSLELEPNCLETQLNLGAALLERGDSDEALEAYRRACALRPDSTEAQTSLGMALADAGDLDAALRCFKRALMGDPEHPAAHFQRALALLQSGDYLQGWEEYEWRVRTKDAPPARQIPCPAWDGSPLAGQTILIHAEQGIGDEIMFGSCLPEVVEAAERCIVTCDRRLETLWRRSFPGADVRGVERGQEDWKRLAEGVDVHLPAGSLPRYLRRDEASFPARKSFLVADPSRVEAWRRRLEQTGAGLKVGIAWRAGVAVRNARRRSTELSLWRDVLSLPGMQFVNLQHGSHRDEAAETERTLGVPIHTFAEADPRGDLDEFAALTASLDLVIAVGCAAVHLAGGLGRPTWCLLPRCWGWRWQLDRADSPWYPSVRIFRQQRDGDWPALLRRVRDELQPLLQRAVA